MQAYKTEKVVSSNGALELTDLPFRPGQRVEIIILEQQAMETRSKEDAEVNPDILIGSVLEYIDSTGPVAVDDWEALR